MIDSLLFLAVLIGTTWLCIWFLQDHRRANQLWSPFDARHLGTDTTDAPKLDGRRGKPPPPPWRRVPERRGGAGRPIPEPPPWRRRSGS